MKQPMFHKRHYEAIAQAVANSPTNDQLVAIAALFMRDNPLFDVHKFLAKCQNVQP